MLTAVNVNNPACPVAATIPEALGYIRALGRYESPHCFELWAATVERLDALEAVVAQLHAVSPEGIFFQTCIAMKGASWWSVYDKDDEKEERTQHQILFKSLRNIARSLYSEAVAGLGEHYMAEVVKEARAA